MPSPIPRAKPTSDRSADETTACDERPVASDDRDGDPSDALSCTTPHGEIAGGATAGPLATVAPLDDLEPMELRRLGRYIVEGRIGKGGSARSSSPATTS